MESNKESTEAVSLTCKTEELCIQEGNGNMEVEKNASLLNEHTLRSQSLLLDENTSFTEHQYSEMVKQADWNDLDESSFKLHSKGSSAVLEAGSDLITEDVVLSPLLKTSLCASPNKKVSMFKKSRLRNRNTCENSELESGKFQEVLQQSSGSDDSCIVVRKSMKSCFRMKKPADANKKTSEFASAEFLSVFHSSTESVNRSKLSVTRNSEDSLILPLKGKKSTCFNKKKSSNIKNSFTSNFEDVLNSSNDSEIMAKKRRPGCDVSLNESAVKKRNSGFLKKRDKNNGNKIDFHDILDSSKESLLSQGNTTTNLEDNIEPSVSKNFVLEKPHNEPEEKQQNDKTGTIDELLRSNYQPETDEVEISHSLSKKVESGPADKKEDSLVDQLKNSNTSREISMEDSPAKQIPAIHLSGAQSENTSKTCREVLSNIERSFSGIGPHLDNQPSLLVSKASDVSSRCYLSNISIQENSFMPPLSNDSQIKLGEIRKPDSISSPVLQLDDYDSMDSDSENEDDSRQDPSDNNVVLKSKIQPNETSVRKETEKDISDNTSLRRSSRNLSHRALSCSFKKSNSNPTVKDLHEKSAKKSITTKLDDIKMSMVVESNSFDGSDNGLGSKATSSHQGNVRTNNASDHYNSLETTNDDTVAEPNNSSLQYNANKEESVFKVPTSDTSSRGYSLRRKNSREAQNISTERSYQLARNSSRRDKSAYNDNDSKASCTSEQTKRRKYLRPQSNTPQTNDENSSQNTMLNFSSFDTRLCHGFSERNKTKKDNDHYLIEKVFSFGNKKLQEINGNDINMGEKYLSKPIKLKKPKIWVSDHLYKFVTEKLELKYDFRARFYAEKFIVYLCEKYDIIVNEKDDFKKHVDELILQMAKLKLVVNLFDFYNFVHKFLPHAFGKKTIPCLRPFGLPNIAAPPPQGTFFDNIL